MLPPDIPLLPELPPPSALEDDPVSLDCMLDDCPDPAAKAGMAASESKHASTV